METNQTEDKKEESEKKHKEDLRISGNDILNFLRKIFRASNSRLAVFENEDGKKLFKINLILLMLICFFIPVIALIVFLVLIAANYSISVQKRDNY